MESFKFDLINSDEQRSLFDWKDRIPLIIGGTRTIIAKNKKKQNTKKRNHKKKQTNKRKLKYYNSNSKYSYI